MRPLVVDHWSSHRPVRQITSAGMPVVENPDGTLWLDVEDVSEAEAVRLGLTSLGVRVTALVPDTTCGTTVEEVSWTELYPRIVPRNGPKPGITVEPAAIPEGHTLLVGVHTIDGLRNGREIVIVLSLIRGLAPPCYSKVISPPLPAPSDPRLYPARAPSS
ncbi:MAG TPA: hypothetical protein VMK12_30065 [Anaeromyxobacteraceae bacterium]|nr:hypothetical protein [Anaeromyxobacteraceae bacterium]